MNRILNAIDEIAYRAALVWMWLVSFPLSWRAHRREDPRV